MRLLLSDTPDDQLIFYMVPDPEKPPSYAILSHTWEEGQEVSFQDVQSNDPSIRTRSGYRKILQCCQLAKKATYKYVWIDTCCIDKTSSAELSEAINSMYKWYGRARICFAYLADVVSASLEEAQKEGSDFRGCRWFTRGWTLQELIAPPKVQFYTVNWERLGDKAVLADTIQGITGIYHTFLRVRVDITRVSVTTKMAWGAQRKTTRAEDMAYSLMGLFGVNMPTIYGEGERAFIRLQHEIMARTPGHGLFAWTVGLARQNIYGPLAHSPDQFARSVDILDVPPHVFCAKWGLQHGAADPRKTPHGIELTLPIFTPQQPYKIDSKRVDAIAVIACKIVDSAHARLHPLGLALQRAKGVANAFVRTYPPCFIRVGCLIDMGIPLTAQPLILVEGSDTLAYDGSRIAPTSIEITIIADAFTCSGIYPPLPPYQHMLSPSLIEGCSRYDEAKSITFIWDGESYRTFQFLRRSTQSSDVNVQPWPFQVCIKRDMNRGILVEASCIHGDGKSTSLPFCSYAERRDRFQCHCGLVADLALIPLKVSSHSSDPRLMLEIEVIEEPLKIEEPSEVKLEPLKLTPRQVLRWVECAAGFFPPDAIQWGGSNYIARVPYQHIGLGLNPELDSKFRPGLCIPVKASTGSQTAYTLSYLWKNSEVATLGYEVLVGPAEDVFLVRCEGRFTLKQLSGATPIDAGCDVDDLKLYFATCNGYTTIVKIGAEPSGSIKKELPYEVVCMRADKILILDGIQG